MGSTLVIRATIALLIGVVCLVWILSWVIYPTEYYMEWLGKITTAVDSTYFGTHERERETRESHFTELQSAGLRLGLVGTLCFSFLFFPITRGSSLLPLVGFSSEAIVKYHIWLGHIVMAIFTAHGLSYFVSLVKTRGMGIA
ncbi:hypothetical protein H6P81_003526 [Aristolochia fimbriata]|uniref:Ferric oxidoreductase domain-containing protein n=1 Tax=Aristolochia fimbriata TaxID=158543 RepID=A0AAV7FH22_ARIFI|nr:hypothetical protein H6P81_003526 [Aristolochia fimbriata]